MKSLKEHLNESLLIEGVDYSKVPNSMETFQNGMYLT